MKALCENHLLVQRPALRPYTLPLKQILGKGVGRTTRMLTRMGHPQSSSHTRSWLPHCPRQTPCFWWRVSKSNTHHKTPAHREPQRDDHAFPTSLVLTAGEAMTTFSITFPDKIPTVNISSRLKATGRGKSQDACSQKLTLHLSHNYNTHYWPEAGSKDIGIL